jgi:hypothetical protein
LRILCGFSIDEIAEAFLTNKETIKKRLFRAKELIRQAFPFVGFSFLIVTPYGLSIILKIQTSWYFYSTIHVLPSI